MKSVKRTVFAVIPITAAVFALAALPLAANAGEGKQYEPPPFAEIDKDGDGFVSEAEFDTHRAEWHATMAERGTPMKGMITASSFAEADSDGDGKLTEAELAAAQLAHKKAMREAHKGMASGQGMRHKPPPLAAMDKDSDGFVSEEEFNNHRAERHAAMAEAGKPMKGMATAPAFADMDSDGDGMLSEAELTAAQQAQKKAMREAHQDMGGGMGGGMDMHKGMQMPTFEDLDLDGNGCINAEEFAKHQAEMHM